MAMEKTFDATEAEARIYKAWEEAGAFKAGANARPGADPFCILLPPPNVTGFLHAGHAFNHTLQDILIRWHRMRGFDTLWQPGTDHAGIATQLVVERKLAENGNNEGRRELGREKFLEKVWEWKAESGGMILEQDKRLGCSMDWSRAAFTMDENFHDAVIRVFLDMYEKGLIYRGKRLVNWDPHFETAISDLEVENVEVDGHMWHFKYPLAGGATYTYVEKDEDGNVVLEEERDYISIATTRPETMLGDGAVAVHPSDERYAPIVGHLCEIPVGPKEHRRLIPIITDDYPDPDFGSGAVKITGAHDFNDYGVAQRNGIPLYSLMDTRGAMRLDGLPYEEAAALAGAIARGEEPVGDVSSINLVPEELRGLDRQDARKAVIAQITEEGLAVMETVTVTDDEGHAQQITRPYVEAKKIMQPFGDRSKVVIEPMLTDQWFVDAEKIVGPALDAVRNGDVKIIPESGEKTYFHWLENIEPWCISRQLWWGHQIPVWYGLDLHAETFRDDEADGALDEVEIFRLLSADRLVHAGQRHHAGADFETIATAFREDNVPLPTPLSAMRVVEVDSRATAIDTLAASLADYNVSQDPTHLIYPVWRDPDVLDTWFSSGLWPIGTLGWPEQTPELEKYHPTSVLVTGSDILFFWVARMMMMQLAVVGEKPFDTVYLHGLVRDAKGKKMSKTTGNVVNPLDIVDEYGADALRFTNAAMASIGGALKLDTDRIKGYRNFGTKLWNACRFAEMNDVFLAPPRDFTSAEGVKHAVNRWILGETAKVRAQVDAALDGFRFNDAANALYAFTWGKVCDWYVELSKPLLQGEDAEGSAETRAVMAFVLDRCLMMLHPFMPFVTEELWGTLRPRDELLITTDWPLEDPAAFHDPVAEAEMSWVIAMIEGVRSARAQMNVPAGLFVPIVQLDADANATTAWAANEAMIRRLARIDRLEVSATAPKGSMTVATPGATFALPLADIIDVSAEKARISKALTRVEKEAMGLTKRLENPKFRANAEAEVVEEAEANLALRNEEIAQLSTALERLAEID